ncbi:MULTISPECIES: hypothetical protein [Rhizobium]|uniref:Uncharacterized protein n=1 Tax=Rhizobium paranaense TaxID=1650438 RepID=A0A7W9D2H0_9HYPH|nr:MULTISPECIES: hypothetical protein [Rhizobium]MBB5575297.1 hypothetical protein [Rhizobium paranaense]
MLIKAIVSAALITLIGLGLSACSTTGNSGGGGMTQNSAPAGGGY